MRLRTATRTAQHVVVLVFPSVLYGGAWGALCIVSYETATRTTSKNIVPRGSNTCRLEFIFIFTWGMLAWMFVKLAGYTFGNIAGGTLGGEENHGTGMLLKGRAGFRENNDSSWARLAESRTIRIRIDGDDGDLPTRFLPEQ